MQYWQSTYENQPRNGEITHEFHHIKPSLLTTNLITFINGNNNKDLTASNFLSCNEDGTQLTWTDSLLGSHILGSAGLGSLTLSGDDVDISIFTPEDKDILIYDDSTNKFKNGIGEISATNTIRRKYSVIPALEINDIYINNVVGDYYILIHEKPDLNASFLTDPKERCIINKTRINIQKRNDPTTFTEFTLTSTPTEISTFIWKFQILNTSNNWLGFNNISNFLDNDDIIISFDFIEITKNEYSKNVDPVATNDINSDYNIGSIWINNINKKSFLCVDNTLNNAIWKPLTDEHVHLTPYFKYDLTLNAPWTTLNTDSIIKFDFGTNIILPLFSGVYRIDFHFKVKYEIQAGTQNLPLELLIKLISSSEGTSTHNYRLHSDLVGLQIEESITIPTYLINSILPLDVLSMRLQLRNYATYTAPTVLNFDLIESSATVTENF